MQGIVLLGAGAQAKYACETFASSDVGEVRFVISPEGSPPVDWPRRYGAQVAIGFDQLIALAAAGEVDSALVCAPDASQKAELWPLVERAGLVHACAIHRSAYVASTAEIGPGAIINPGAIIQPFARLGRGVMIHANVIVEHDCVVGDWANLAPGCQLAGWVEIGEGATVFTGASVIPSRKVGAGAVIGAGAVVTRDVPAGATVTGVPAVPAADSGRSP